MDATMHAFRSEVQQLVARVAQRLPDPRAVPRDRLFRMFEKYAHVFGKNFAPWMAATWVNTQNAEARRICWDNLRCEVNDDHPAMLERLLRSIPQDDPPLPWGNGAASAITLRVQLLAAFCGQQLGGLLIMAALENASLAFIPWMESAAAILGATDTEYLRVHGEADRAHAEAFIAATELELAETGIPLILQGSESFSLLNVEYLLETIFS